MKGLLAILLSSFLVLSSVSRSAAEPVERIAGVLNGQIIFLSDLQRYHTFFETPESGSEEDSKKELERVIDNRLLRLEAHRFILQGPSDAEVQQRLKLLRERFKTEGALQDALRQTGFSLDELKREIGEQLWVEKLLQERIYAFVFITPKEIAQYYQAHAAEFGGKKQEEAEPAIRKILSEEKRTTKEREYLDRLRSHAEIQVNLQ